MERVTIETYKNFLARYDQARGGALNTLTYSEVMFVFGAPSIGVFILTTGVTLMWIGVQNASAWWSNAGKPFSSVDQAVETVLMAHVDQGELYYSEDSAERCRKIAELIDTYKKQTPEERVQ